MYVCIYISRELEDEKKKSQAALAAQSAEKPWVRVTNLVDTNSTSTTKNSTATTAKDK
jgi:hypothetical protein